MMHTCLLVSLQTPDLSSTNPALRLTKPVTQSPQEKASRLLLPPASRVKCFFPTTLSWGCTKGMGLGVTPGFEVWLRHFLAVWSWAGYSSPLNRSFIIRNTEGYSPI